MKRRWFTYDDGTYFRNCPLIMQEAEGAARHHRFRLARKLHEEWGQTFSRGVQYKETLGKDEEGIPFPNSPISAVLPGLAGRIPAGDLAEMDARVMNSPNLPGDPRFRWCYEW